MVAEAQSLAPDLTAIAGIEFEYNEKKFRILDADGGCDYLQYTDGRGAPQRMSALALDHIISTASV